MHPIRDLLYVRFRVPDLEHQRKFLDDFGFTTIMSESGELYARGTDASPYVYIAEEMAEEGEAEFLAMGFEATSESALEEDSRFKSAFRQNGRVLDLRDFANGGDYLSWNCKRRPSHTQHIVKVR